MKSLGTASVHQVPGRPLRRAPQRGFTLTELMIVVGLIATLGALVLPSTMKARQQAQLTACTENLKSLMTAHTLYLEDHGGRGVLATEWPTDSDLYGEVQPTGRVAEGLGGYIKLSGLTCPAYRSVSRLGDLVPVPKDPRTVADLASHYLPVVESECRRFRRRLPSHLDLEDMVQEARTAFQWALNSFDPARSGSFPAFVRLRVRGAILNWLHREGRAQRWPLELGQEAGRAWRDLRRSLGREPHEEELASVLGLTVDHLQRYLEVAEPVALSPLDPPAEGDDPAFEVERREIVRRVSQAMKALPELDRSIVNLHYFDELSLRESAEVLGEERNRVRRRHQQALFRLRAELADLVEGRPERPPGLPPGIAALLGVLWALPALG